jgi:hypothetical protein
MHEELLLLRSRRLQPRLGLAEGPLPDFQLRWAAQGRMVASAQPTIQSALPYCRMYDELGAGTVAWPRAFPILSEFPVSCVGVAYNVLMAIPPEVHGEKYISLSTLRRDASVVRMPV